jgi:hypothetical protein
MEHINLHNLDRVVGCQGSAALIRQFGLPQQDQSAAEEGIQAHAVAAAIHADGDYSAANGDEEMIDSCLMYVDYINSIQARSATGSGSQLVLEAPVQNDDLRLQGRPDCSIYDRVADHLHVFEFKYGRGFVDAFENFQLLGAAACILPTIGSTLATRVTLHVIQPRCFQGDGPIRSWTPDRSEFLAYVEKIRHAVKICLDPHITAMCSVGTHCYRCPAARACTSLERSGFYAMDLAYTDNGGRELSGEELGYSLRHLEKAQKILGARITGLTEDATFRLQLGQQVPGFSLQTKWGALKWLHDEATVIFNGMMNGFTFTKQKLITPTQAKKLPGIDPALIDAWAVRTQTAPTLNVDNTAKLCALFKGDSQ